MTINWLNNLPLARFACDHYDQMETTYRGRCATLYNTSKQPISWQLATVATKWKLSFRSVSKQIDFVSFFPLYGSLASCLHHLNTEASKWFMTGKRNGFLGAWDWFHFCWTSWLLDNLWLERTVLKLSSLEYALANCSHSVATLLLGSFSSIWTKTLRELLPRALPRAHAFTKFPAVYIGIYPRIPVTQECRVQAWGLACSWPNLTYVT